MNPAVPARIQGYFARKAPVCVIVRRGPTKYTQLIRWRTDIDLFEPGQWMRGKVDAFSMTSDGAYAAIKVMGARSRLHSWEDTQVVILCRPPYLTALEVYIGGLCLTHAEFLPDDRLLARGGVHSVHAQNRCPFERIERLGERVEFAERNYDLDARWRQAVGVDQGGRRIRMHYGRIFAGDAGQERLLFDCNDYAFEEVVAPKWAARW